MTEYNSFEMVKNNNLREVLPSITYGIVAEVYDDATVKAAAIIQEVEDLTKCYDVTLLSFSSALFETSVKPKVGDHVLILPIASYHYDMFEAQTPSVKTASRNACLGLLVSTAKQASSIQARIDDAYTLELSMDTNIKACQNMRIELSEVSFHSSENGAVSTQIRAPLDIEIGFDRTEDKNPVSAPINITLAEDADIMFNSDSAVEIGAKDITVSVKENVEVDVQGTCKISAEKDLDIESNKPIGLNSGLRSDCLGPFWSAQKDAFQDLLTSATTAASSASASPYTAHLAPFFADLIKFSTSMMGTSLNADAKAQGIIK